MYGDFSRPPLVPGDNITRVYFNQGQPLIEADLNETISALIESPRTLFRSLIKTNPAIGAVGDGFKLGANDEEDEEDSFTIADGFFSFNGMLVEKREKHPAASFKLLPDGSRYLVAFDSKEAQGTPQTGKFVVALAARERPLLLAETVEHRPWLAELRSANFFTLESGVFLEPLMEKKPNEWETVEEAKGRLVARNTFTAPLEEIDFKDFPSEYRGRLLRLELHRVITTRETNDKTQYEFKLAIDNAGYAFAAEGSGNNLSLFQGGFGGQTLPRPGEYLEIERRDSWSWLGDAPNEFIKVKDSKDKKVVLQEPLKADLDPAKDQVRRWIGFHTAQVVKPDNPAAPSALSLEFGLLKVTLRSKDFANDLRSGDHWLFSLNTKLNRIDVQGFRRPHYFAALASVVFDGGVPSISNPEFRPSLELADFARPVDAPPPDMPVSKSPGTERQAFSVASAPFAGDLPCDRLFGDLTYLPVRRWLASMTLGEIDGLSRADLRKRILRDCGAAEVDDEALERDLARVLAKRDEFRRLQTAYA